MSTGRTAPFAPGRTARAPGDLPAAAWWQISGRVWHRVLDDHLVLISAGVAFFGAIAIPPTLLAALAVYGLVTPANRVEDQLARLSEVLPADIEELVVGQLRTITSQSPDSLSLGALLALVFALVTASTGMDNLIQAVSLAYDEKETRPWYRRRVLALMFVGGVIVVLGGVVAVNALVPLLVADAPTVVRVVVTALFWLGMALVVMLTISAVYRYAPDREDAQWRWVSWGAVLATLTWVLVSLGFFLYVSAFGSYNRTYGALAGVVITLLWLLLSSLAVLLGAEVNAEMEKQTAYDTTTGPERPMGRRGAFAADNAAPYPDNNSRP